MIIDEINIVFNFLLSWYRGNYYRYLPFPLKVLVYWYSHSIILLNRNMEVELASDLERLFFTLESLQALVVSKGGYVNPNIQFKHDSEAGVGIFAKQTVGRNDVALSIPFSMCISVDMVARDANLGGIFAENPGLFDYPDEVLAIGLMYAALHHEIDCCEWSIHSRTLPKTLNTTLFWTEEELYELKDTNVFHLTRMMKAQIANDWTSIHEPIANTYAEQLSGATIELYTWSLAMVYSRAIGIRRDGRYVRCIPPVLDMANHSMAAGNEASDTFLFDESQDSIKLLVTRGHAAGEEIHAVYGDYGNAKLAHTYGFVQRSPSHVAVDLWTKISPKTSHGVEKQAILQSHALTATQTYDFEGTIRSGGVISSALLTTIRVMQANAEELESHAVELAYSDKKIISVRNELASYASLRELLLVRMKAEVAEVQSSQ